MGNHHRGSSKGMHSLICMYCNGYICIFRLSLLVCFPLKVKQVINFAQDWQNHLQSNKKINPLIRCLKIDKTSYLIIVHFINEHQRMQLQISFYHILVTDNRIKKLQTNIELKIAVFTILKLVLTAYITH